MALRRKRLKRSRIVPNIDPVAASDTCDEDIDGTDSGGSPSVAGGAETGGAEAIRAPAYKYQVNTTKKQPLRKIIKKRR